MALDRVQRRMAAILAADVAGYSRLMGKDEENTLATLKTYRSIIDSLIANHTGRSSGAQAIVLLRSSRARLRRSAAPPKSSSRLTNAMRICRKRATCGFALALILAMSWWTATI